MKYTDPHYSCDYLNFFIEKRENPYNQKTKDYVVAFHARNGFFEEPALSREDLKGLADFIYYYLQMNVARQVMVEDIEALRNLGENK
jgi:hypothetical protein